MTSFDDAIAAADELRRRTGREKHDVGVVLGSGWALAADQLGAPDLELDMDDIVGVPAPTVTGHRGTIRSVSIGAAAALVLVGRSHLYEGHAATTVVQGVRAAILAGCRTVVLTNAAGAVDPTMRVGEPVLIADHLNLTGHNPLTGPPPPSEWGARFVDLSDVYSARLRGLARTVDPSLREGVYAMFLGPSYETKAEVRMARALGADLVGMSTALEAIAARQLGAEVVALSLVTNAAAGTTDDGIDHDEVLATGRHASDRLGALLRGIVERILAS